MKPVPASLVRVAAVVAETASAEKAAGANPAGSGFRVSGTAFSLQALKNLSGKG